MEYLNRFTTTLDRKLEPHVQSHLKNVYSTVAMSTLAASAGAYAQIYTNLGNIIGPFLTFILTLGCFFMLATTPHNEKTESTRLGYLLGVAFLSGTSLGPLIDVTLYINPNILPTALTGTFVIFACFTISTLFSDRRKYLYYSSVVLSFCSMFFFMALINIFLRIEFLHQMYLYATLAMLCAFVVFDTVKIIELRLMGDTDYIQHAGILFLDMVRIFHTLLVLLTDKDQRDKRNKRRN